MHGRHLLALAPPAMLITLITLIEPHAYRLSFKFHTAPAGARAIITRGRVCIYHFARRRSAAVNGFDLSVITRRIDGIERHTGLNVSALK